MREARRSAPKTKPRVVTAFGRNSNAPVVTYSLIGITVVVYLLQLFTGGVVTDALFYHPVLTATEPWRMITAIFLHSQNSFLHIAFNMYALWLFGRLLEHALGRLRFLALYMLSGFGGSVAVLWLAPASGVLGASGAVFGLFGAFFIIQRRLGGNATQLLVVIGLNLAIGFFVPGISWQAHVGGLVVGCLVALIYLRTRALKDHNKQLVLLAATFGLLVLLSVAGAATVFARLLG